MTTHKDEIVERLRHDAEVMREAAAHEWAGDCDEAADLIEQQASTIERMEGARAKPRRPH